ADLPYTVLRDQIFTHPTMSESLNDLFSLIK
ncbi:pyruvate dehydrogenase, partial [Salmonella enterica]|nr:pyruvate dehydrogenase [Salmonella enterica]